MFVYFCPILVSVSTGRVGVYNILCRADSRCCGGAQLNNRSYSKLPLHNLHINYTSRLDLHCTLAEEAFQAIALVQSMRYACLSQYLPRSEAFGANSVLISDINYYSVPCHVTRYNTIYNHCSHYYHSSPDNLSDDEEEEEEEQEISVHYVSTCRGGT